MKIDATVHGFRSSFRDWCSENGVAREIAELCLAHLIGNAVEQAYARSTVLNRRREVMQSWADFLWLRSIQLGQLGEPPAARSPQTADSVNSEFHTEQVDQPLLSGPEAGFSTFRSRLSSVVTSQEVCTLQSASAQLRRP